MTCTASWIWIDTETPDEPNRHAEFRRVLTVDEPPQEAELRISVDTNFVAWVNGEFAGTGQFSDFPDRKAYARIDVRPMLRRGRNALALLVYYCGVDHFSYLPGHAGLWYELEVDGRVIAASDAATVGRYSPCYQPDCTARITPQRAFTFHYDANFEDGWTGSEPGRTEHWRPAVPVDSGAAPQPRPLPMCELHPCVEGDVIAQGVLRREGPAGATVAEQMQHDYLSARRSWELFVGLTRLSHPCRGPLTIDAAGLGEADGCYVVYALGREECGAIDLAVECESPCVIDIAVGEHLDDLRVRSHVGGRNFASRYRARPGQQRFTHYLDRYAGRYLQVHLTGMKGMVRLSHVGLRPLMYPVRADGAFSSSDALSDRLWRTAARTLHLCMHEHFEDCPGREQALYGNDSRSQMLFSYYAFADYDFARASLDLLARSTQADGYQSLCAPMKFPVKIPGFTLTWFLAVRDYLYYSGDEGFVRETLPRIEWMLGQYLATLTDDLLPCPRGERYWHFYDWAEGLDGTYPDDCSRFEVVSDTRFDAPLNLLLILALQAAAELAACIHDRAFETRCRGAADKLGRAVHEMFWDREARAYATYCDKRGRRHHAQLTQSLAILAGLGDTETRSRLRARLAEQDAPFVPTTLSQSLYKYQAILIDESYARRVFDEVRQVWSSMLFAGATTFWETLGGGWDFQHAGSLCHGWASLPLYLYGAYGLGIKPLAPGFCRFAVNPLPVFSHAAGAVPTPRGPVHVALQWHANACESDIRSPTDTEAVVAHRTD